MHISIGQFDIETGGLLVKKFGFYIPDGLHVWIGNKGLHYFWSVKPHFEMDKK